MSSDFYFRKWKETLARLEDTVNFDLNYQTLGVHDKMRCQATQRLSSVLGQYMSIYNDIIDCVNQNLQVQKTAYMIDILQAVVSRIEELKSDMNKLECNNCQFFGYGLAKHHLTTFNIEMLQLPTKVKRSVYIETLMEEMFKRNRERREAIVRKDEEDKRRTNFAPEKVNWWNIDETSECTTDNSGKQEEEQLSEETLKTKEMIILIQANEKSKQVRNWVRYRNYKRELWVKELNGNAPLLAPYKMREKAAKLLQKVFRTYFEMKRQRIKDCKRDEILGLKQCEKFNINEQINAQKVKIHRLDRLKELEPIYTKSYVKRKMEYLKTKGDYIMEDWRGFIRDWFHKWFTEVQFFYDIPTLNEDGPAIIIKEEIPSPAEWLAEYKRRTEEKASNKNKTAMQIKFEKMEARRLEMMLKREEIMKKKQEKILLQKMMKNPNMHPGFIYPESKKTIPILHVINNYKNEWNEVDSLESSEAKETFVKEIQLSKVYMEAKLEMLVSVESDMKRELKMLKTALKTDYTRNKEKLPEKIKTPTKRTKRKLKLKATLSENVIDRMEDLVMRGILNEYKKVKLEDFVGDPNFVGEDLRCSYKTAERHNGEMRYIWWDICREAGRGVQKTLLVGPKGSGKSQLVQILASLNGAILFEIDPLKLDSELISPVYLLQIVNSVALCAKAVQPSVIHVKNIQKLFYSTVPEYEKDLNLDLIKRYIIKRLLKKIHKTDKITVIGSCEIPWRTKSKELLKEFSTVLLLPNTSYSTVVQTLKDWIYRNHIIPKDLNVSSLGYLLQGYTYGYLEESLKNFLSPERIIRIAANGLSAEEIYDFIINDNVEAKSEYEKYQKWYTEKTSWGQKEKRHVEEQQEFQRTLEKYAETVKKKRPIQSARSSNSNLKIMK